MPILAKFEKQPADIQDYDISFVEWLEGYQDAGASQVTAVKPGITLMASALLSGVVKVWLSGGLNGTSYKVTTTLATTGGRVKQAEIVIKVKEV